MTAIAFGWPSAVNRVPSSGSTATSTCGPVPSPTGSPLKSIGASSFSPSPITTMPSIETESSIARIPSTAAWSAAILLPRPTQRPAPSAAASVTRTSSSARFRSGGLALIGQPLSGKHGFPHGSEPKARDAHNWLGSLHPFGRLDPDQVEGAGDHVLRCAYKGQPERLRLRADDSMLD